MPFRRAPSCATGPLWRLKFYQRGNEASTRRGWCRWSRDACIQKSPARAERASRERPGALLHCLLRAGLSDSERASFLAQPLGTGLTHRLLQGTADLTGGLGDLFPDLDYETEFVRFSESRLFIRPAATSPTATSRCPAATARCRRSSVVSMLSFPTSTSRTPRRFSFCAGLATAQRQSLLSRSCTRGWRAARSGQARLPDDWSRSTSRERRRPLLPRNRRWS